MSRANVEYKRINLKLIVLYKLPIYNMLFIKFIQWNNFLSSVLHIKATILNDLYFDFD